MASGHTRTNLELKWGEMYKLVMFPFLWFCPFLILQVFCGVVKINVSLELC